MTWLVTTLPNKQHKGPNYPKNSSQNKVEKNEEEK